MYDQPGSDPVYWTDLNKKSKLQRILEKTRKEVAQRKYFEWDDGEITNVMYQYVNVEHVMIAIEESGRYVMDGVWHLDDNTFLIRDDFDLFHPARTIELWTYFDNHANYNWDDYGDFITDYNNYFNK